MQKGRKISYSKMISQVVVKQLRDANFHVKEIPQVNYSYIDPRLWTILIKLKNDNIVWCTSRVNNGEHPDVDSKFYFELYNSRDNRGVIKIDGDDIDSVISCLKSYQSRSNGEREQSNSKLPPITKQAYFIKRLRDSGYWIERLPQATHNKGERKEWTILIDPKGSNILCTCHSDGAGKSNCTFTLYDGSQFIPNRLTIDTNSIEVIVERLMGFGIEPVNEITRVTK